MNGPQAPPDFNVIQYQPHWVKILVWCHCTIEYWGGGPGSFYLLDYYYHLVLCVPLWCHCMCHCGATVCATDLCPCVCACLPACLPACYYYAIIITRLPACLLLLCYYYYAIIITTLCCVCRCGATVCATDLPACLRVCLPACLPALLPDLCSHAGLGFHKGQHVAGRISSDVGSDSE